MSVDNILAVFLLPLIGSFSDKVDTRIGKRTPFIIVGTLLAVCSMMLLPLSDRTHNFWLFVIALAVTLIAMALYRSPSVALMPDLTPKPLRSKANAVINLMGAIGGVYALILISKLIPKTKTPSYLPVFIGVGAIMIFAVVLLLLTTNEKKLSKKIAMEYPEEIALEQQEDNLPLTSDIKRSLFFILISISLWFMAYNAVTTAFSRYANTVWKLQGGGFASCLMVATVAAIFSYIPIGFLSSHFGRKKTILCGILIMIGCYIAASLYPTYHPTINIFFALIGFAWAAINVNSLPMVVEMSRGSDIGKYTGLYYTFSMSAQIITPILSGIFLQHISYRTLFPYAIIFMILAFITMLQVKHGDSRPIKKESILENFDVED